MVIDCIISLITHLSLDAFLRKSCGDVWVQLRRFQSKK